MIIDNNLLTPYELATIEKTNRENAFNSLRNTWFPSQISVINDKLTQASKADIDFITISVPKTLNNYIFLQEEIYKELKDFFNYVYNIEITSDSNNYTAKISWDDNDTVRTITIEGSETTFTLESDSEVVFCPEDTERIIQIEKYEDLGNINWMDGYYPARLSSTDLYKINKIEITPEYFNTRITFEIFYYDNSVEGGEVRQYETIEFDENNTTKNNIITLPEDLTASMKFYWNKLKEENSNDDEYIKMSSNVPILSTVVYSIGQHFTPNSSTFPYVAPKDFIPQEDLESLWKKDNEFTLQLKERDPSDINYGKETTLYIYNKNETSTN